MPSDFRLNLPAWVLTLAEDVAVDAPGRELFTHPGRLRVCLKRVVSLPAPDTAEPAGQAPPELAPATHQALTRFLADHFGPAAPGMNCLALFSSRELVDLERVATSGNFRPFPVKTLDELTEVIKLARSSGATHVVVDPGPPGSPIAAKGVDLMLGELQQLADGRASTPAGLWPLPGGAAGE
jgi:hypothetical protein